MSAGTPPTDRDLTPALAEFATLLGRRLQRSQIPNEDTVRYTFYYALIEGLKLKPEDIMVESKHITIGHARLDLTIFLFSESKYSFEFKYEKLHTSTSGQVPARMLKDVFKLAALHGVGNALQHETVLVYLTAQWAKKYFRNPKWQLSGLFDLPIGRSLSLDEGYIKQRPNINCGVLTKGIGTSFHAKSSLFIRVVYQIITHFAFTEWTVLMLER